MKSPEPGNKAQRKVKYKNYHAQLLHEGKLLQEIISENYPLVYYHAKNVRFIGILAYPKSNMQVAAINKKQGRKRPLDTPKRMIKRREKEGKKEKER